MDAMSRPARVIACLAVLAGALALALTTGATPARAATPCAERVIADWSDNGRIDGLYRLECYESAIDTIPVDLRDYTNAAEIISRALTAASRERPPSGGAGAAATLEAAPTADAASESAVPLPVILVVCISVVVLAAGALSHLLRRQRRASRRGRGGSGSRPSAAAAD
jgi:hypothetical protein